MVIGIVVYYLCYRLFINSYSIFNSVFLFFYFFILFILFYFILFYYFFFGSPGILAGLIKDNVPPDEISFCAIFASFFLLICLVILYT